MHIFTAVKIADATPITIGATHVTRHSSLFTGCSSRDFLALLWLGSGVLLRLLIEFLPALFRAKEICHAAVGRSQAFFGGMLLVHRHSTNDIFSHVLILSCSS